MKKIFLDYDQAGLDAQYDQRVWAPNVEEILRRYALASQQARLRLGEPRNCSYGPTQAETMDVYGSSQHATFVMVHGGAWNRMSRREYAFGAETIVRAGAAYVALGFALLPTVTLPEMVGQVRRALIWIQANLPGKILLCGHSSGAHLSACALVDATIVDSALLVSGLYDLLPVRLSARNSYVRLDQKIEHELSPLRHAGRIVCPVTVAWSENESVEFSRQSREFADKLKAPTVQGAGMNHFELIESLADPGSPLASAALAMIR